MVRLGVLVTDSLSYCEENIKTVAVFESDVGSMEDGRV